jgi:hypothetical protein
MPEKAEVLLGLAALPPARRASPLEPMRVLRME